ncbi:hypothetical protein BDN72DRAFT_535487 [Pluteus cervinus]|uniref:Uncharacterized protein n=1 Tax=Pluteus cervinus TaxID=181527 RepID=A0ACD3A3N1_9AGAR|nr:hypothetical protein BDN72DRAFT_535487 [Pluteus cervinus]
MASYGEEIIFIQFQTPMLVPLPPPLTRVAAAAATAAIAGVAAATAAVRTTSTPNLQHKIMFEDKVVRNKRRRHYIITSFQPPPPPPFIRLRKGHDEHIGLVILWIGVPTSCGYAAQISRDIWEVQPSAVDEIGVNADLHSLAGGGSSSDLLTLGGAGKPGHYTPTSSMANSSVDWMMDRCRGTVCVCVWGGGG